MDINLSFGKALKLIRKKRGLTQEDFSDVSSRTYMSTLERGMKSITLEKLEDIAGVLGVHPITILLMTYSEVGEDIQSKELLNRLVRELAVVKA
ncbi:MAG: helix-turn-helix transcriptional regulator [Methylotenera sp.]|jgi:transcriptional regulator with XRE-family HTH domain|nr:helix-turn-helix transcriptional regulator [Methylotenera sp.]